MTVLCMFLMPTGPSGIQRAANVFSWDIVKQQRVTASIIMLQGKCMIMVLYVDDLVMTGNHEDKISQTKHMLGREFEMTDLGLMHFYLGIEVWQESN